MLTSPHLIILECKSYLRYNTSADSSAHTRLITRYNEYAALYTMQHYSWCDECSLRYSSVSIVAIDNLVEMQEQHIQ